MAGTPVFRCLNGNPNILQLVAERKESSATFHRTRVLPFSSSSSSSSVVPQKRRATFSCAPVGYFPVPCANRRPVYDLPTTTVHEDKFRSAVVTTPSGSAEKEIEAARGFTKGAMDTFSVAAMSVAASFLLCSGAMAEFLSYDHADMRGADLSFQNLKRAVFAACDCRMINLKGSDLSGTTDTFAGFEYANLEDTNWERALADRVVFRNANLRNGADITGADFTDALVDKSQQLKMCRRASGENTKTGVSTRESLYC
eukprot:TRINITY_DN5400_c0_g1_i7.p1 TRINITY_DN5400_c0_g1~~TRINITY_DN5400_c0_g1_i7.p1  ORF type:complete len:276 (-),score=38.69 TRINITY_DN5400_c0_g1_i7:41-811(-)